MQNEFDIAVIGGGSGGYAAARTGAAAGKKVVVIDGAEELAGLCILRGCMPSKTLIETANRNLAIREAGEFGIEVPRGKVDTKKVIARKRRLIGEFQEYREEQLTDGRFELIRGSAKFLDAKTLEITLREGGDKRTIKAKTTIIATGSTIFVPEIEGLEEAGFLDSDDVLDDENTPESIIVLGGGAIALELAHYYEAIGCEVTVIQRSAHLLTGMDHDVADELEAALTSRTMKVFCGTKLKKVMRENGKKVVVFEHEGEEKKVAAHEILCALGRHANSAGLDCEKAGIELRKDKVIVENSMQTTAANIFAAGDVCGPFEIVHLAIEQGEMAARNLVKFLNGEGDSEKMDYRLVLYGIFTHPQVAYVGMTEIEAAEKKRAVLVEKYPFNDHGKSMVHGSKHGFVKLIADAETREILGGAVVGPEGVELIHEIVVAMAFHATAGQLAKIPHYHPTLSEIWTYPAEELAEE